MSYVIQFDSKRQKKEVLKLLAEMGIKVEKTKYFYKRTKLEERRNQVENELNQVGKKYLKICQKEIGMVPEKVVLKVLPDKPVMIIYNKDGEEMQLEGQGEVERLKSVWLHILKKFTGELRKDDINETVLEFEINNVASIENESISSNVS